MATTTHEGQIDITIPLAAIPVQQAGFSRVAAIYDDLNLGGSGDRSKLYAGSSAVADAIVDQAAAEISTAALDCIQTAFAQKPQISDFLLIERDVTPGAETYAQALAAAELDTGTVDFYGVCIESRDPSLIAPFAATIEASTTPYLFVFQDDDTGWYTAVPAAYSSVADAERCVLCHHDTDAEKADVAVLCSRLVYDADEKSAGWTGRLRNVASQSTPPTAGELAVLTNGTVAGNTVLPFGSATTYFSPGQNLAARPIYEIVTADWFEARLREALINLRLEHDDRGDKIGADADGEALVEKEIRALVLKGEAAAHFVEDALLDEDGNDTLSVSSNAATRTISTTGTVTTKTDVINFSVTIALTK